MIKPAHLLIPQHLAQTLHDYLTTRPMREVEPFVVAIRSLKPPDTAGSNVDVAHDLYKPA
jgi:hypothetical protein